MMAGVVPAVDAQRRAAFEALFRAHYQGIEAFVRFQYPSVDGADILSATFETAWRRLDDIPAAAHRGWLVGVARNHCMNALRSQRRSRNHLDSFIATRTRFVHELHHDSLPPEMVDVLQEAFSALRPGDQEVLLLAAWDGLTGDDLGEALGTTGATAAVRLFRARERLRAKFDKLGGGA